MGNKVWEGETEAPKGRGGATWVVSVLVLMTCLSPLGCHEHLRAAVNLGQNHPHDGLDGALLKLGVSSVR